MKNLGTITDDKAVIVKKYVDDELSGKAVKDTNATTGNIAVFDSSGNCVDGGLAFSIVNGCLRVTYPD